MGGEGRLKGLDKKKWKEWEGKKDEGEGRGEGRERGGRGEDSEG
jgi:hypothetical protein